MGHLLGNMIQNYQTYHHALRARMAWQQLGHCSQSLAKLLGIVRRIAGISFVTRVLCLEDLLVAMGYVSQDAWRATFLRSVRVIGCRLPALTGRCRARTVRVRAACELWECSLGVAPAPFGPTPRHGSRAPPGRVQDIEWLTKIIGVDSELALRTTPGHGGVARTLGSKTHFPGAVVTYAAIHVLQQIAGARPDRLQLIASATVTKLLATGGKVTGVEYSTEGVRRAVRGRCMCCMLCALRSTTYATRHRLCVVCCTPSALCYICCICSHTHKLAVWMGVHPGVEKVEVVRGRLARCLRRQGQARAAQRWRQVTAARAFGPCQVAPPPKCGLFTSP